MMLVHGMASAQVIIRDVLAQITLPDPSILDSDVPFFRRLSARRITSDQVEQKDVYSIFIGGFDELVLGPMATKDRMGNEVEVMELVVYRRPSEEPLVQIPVYNNSPSRPPSPREPGTVFDEDDESDNSEVFDEGDDSYYATLDIGESDEDGIASQL